MARFIRGAVRVVIASSSVGDGNPYHRRELPATLSKSRVSFAGYLLDRQTWQRAGRLATVAPQRVFVEAYRIPGQGWTSTGVVIPAWVRIARHLTVALDA